MNSVFNVKGGENMTRSLLHRLPDIIAIARARARNLLDQPREAPPPHPPPDGPRAHDARQVHLLHGNDLAAMLGLLDGRGAPGPLRGRVPLIWLAPAPRPGPDNGHRPARWRTHDLVNLAVRLFVARELLLPQDGLLAAPMDDDPGRLVGYLLDALFGRARTMPEGFDHPCAAGARVYLAGPRAATADARMDGATRQHELVERHSPPGSPVLVAPAEPICAEWVAALDRCWILVQPDGERFARLHEQVVAHQRAQGRSLRAPAQTRSWSVLS